MTYQPHFVEDVIELLIKDHFPDYTSDGIALHQDCLTCDWIRENISIVDNVYRKMFSSKIDDKNKLAENAWDRFVGRIETDLIVETDRDVLIKNSWIALFNFVRSIASQGINWNLNKLAHSFVMPFGLLETLRSAEKELTNKAVNALRESEGLVLVIDEKVVDEEEEIEVFETGEELVKRIKQLESAIREAAEAMEDEGLSNTYIDIYDGILNKAIGRRPHWAA